MAVGFGLNTGNQGAVKYPDPTTNVVNEVFKKFYLPAIRDQLNSKRILTKIIDRDGTAISGEHAIMALRVGRNEGIGFIAEQAILPDPGKQQYKQINYRMRYDYGRILFTGPALASSRNNRGAFIRILDGEIKGLAQDKQHENNRVMFGDGSGRLARVSNVAGAEILVDNPGGFANSGPGTQYLRVGMRVSINDTNVGGATPVFTNRALGSYTAYKITSIDPSTGAIALTNAAGTTGKPTGVAVGDFLYRYSEETTASISDGALSAFNEPFGIAALIGTGNPFGPSNANFFVGGLDASSEGYWNAALVDNGGVAIPFNQEMLQVGEDNLDILSDSSVNVNITTHGIRRQFLSTLVSSRRYVNTMTLEGGFRALEYNGKPLVVDKDCTRGRIYGLNLQTLKIFYEEDYHWMDEDGSYLHRLPNFDAFQALMMRYWCMGTDKRNGNLLITDIQDA